jgi:hypothetical protein
VVRALRVRATPTRPGHPPRGLTGKGPVGQSEGVARATGTSANEAERVPLERPVIIVRRGMVGRFAALQAGLATDGVEVRWDRRVEERRRRVDLPPTEVERRRQDRRGPVPSSWVLLDFVLVWAPRTQAGAPGVPSPIRS